MDVALEAMRVAGHDWRAALGVVMAEIELCGFDGSSVLWHDTVFGGAQISSAVAASYWELPSAGARWVVAREVVVDAERAARAAGLVSA
jgi:hypothetical protein